MKLLRVTKFYEDDLQVSRSLKGNTVNVIQSRMPVFEYTDNECIETFISSDNSVNKVLNSTLVFKKAVLLYECGNIAAIVETRRKDQANVIFQYSGVVFSDGIVCGDLAEISVKVCELFDYYMKNIDLYIRNGKAVAVCG